MWKAEFQVPLKQGTWKPPGSLVKGMLSKRTARNLGKPQTLRAGIRVSGSPRIEPDRTQPGTGRREGQEENCLGTVRGRRRKRSQIECGWEAYEPVVPMKVAN